MFRVATTKQLTVQKLVESSVVKFNFCTYVSSSGSRLEKLSSSISMLSSAKIDY